VKRLLASGLVMTALAVAAIAAESLTELMAASKRMAGRVIYENDFVRVHNTILEYPPAPRRVAEDRPVVLYLRLGSDQGFAKTRLLEPPRGARPSWHPGIVPLGIWIELLKPAPRPSSLGDPGTYPPRDAIEETEGWGGGSLYIAAFRPFDYAVGLGPLPTVAVFLSDGVVEVSTKGLRRRMAVQAGYAEWFEERTRLPVVDDYTVGVAFLQVPTR
jgi:hypothetical protein